MATIDDDEPIWLRSSQVIAMNRVVLTGEERHHVRDRLSLEGALSRPWTLWSYNEVTDLFELGSRLTAALVLAHAFEQGNKRTAFQAGLTFLMTNGSPVEPLDMVEFAQLVEAIAKRDPAAESALATAFREYVVPVILE